MRSYFPSVKLLTDRLQKRFGSGAPPNVTAAIQTLEGAVAAKWESAADLEARRKDLRSALKLISPVDVDAEVSYLRTAVDLQVSKAASLRTYCSIIIAIAIAIALKLAPQPAVTSFVFWPSVVALGLALVAALSSLTTSWTSWPSEKNFETPEAEVTWLVQLLAFRGRLSNLAVSLSFCATLLIGGATTYAVYVLRDSIQETPVHIAPVDKVPPASAPTNNQQSSAARPIGSAPH